jgi:hypothetical protein
MASTAQPADTRLSIDHLINEYDGWKSVLDRDTDDFDAFAKLTALYRFAITNYSEPGVELLLDAIAAVEAAEKER